MENVNQDTENKTIKNCDLFEVWVKSDKNAKVLMVFQKIKESLELFDCSQEIDDSLMVVSQYFCLKIKDKWKNCLRNRKTFAKRHKCWLNKAVKLPDIVANTSERTGTDSNPGSSRGRPPVRFEDASLKTKKRRVAELIKENTYEELSFAAEISRPRTSVKSNQPQCLTPKQALALYCDLDLSERKYNILRSVVNAIHNDCFPSLHALRREKKQVLPSKITVTEISAAVDVQDVLNKTAESIVETTKVEIANNAKLTCKWGFDGSAGHSVYKQKFDDTENTDEFMFVIAFVPLKLTDTTTGRNLWVNMRPSSTLFCRPIKFIFVKEKPDVVRGEESRMQTAIKQLKPHRMLCNGQEVEVTFDMLFTMLDGSVANTLSNTSAPSRCYICGAAPKEMNLTTVTSKVSNTDNYRFGLSTLHSWIRFFECLLHISYRLPFKTWQVRGEENKTLFDANKKRIQANFKSKMGLIVDKPKQGFGTSNDGNTARRFFSNPALSAEITGVDQSLIQNFSLILRILASGRTIDTSKFKKLLAETRELYLKLYSWYYMPTTVHKVLIHGCDIINFFDLPIGCLSEEALEARHKEIRKNRLYHTRKSSRINTNRDLMNVLLLTSDPAISSQRKVTSKQCTIFDDTGIEEYFLSNNPYSDDDNAESESD